MPTLNTTVVLLLIVYLHSNVVVRGGWEAGATNDSFVVLQTKDNSQKISKAPIALSEATTYVSRDQSRVCESARFGTEEGAHVESIDVVKWTEKLETLETSRLLDVSGDVAAFEPSPKRDGVVSEMHGEVESVGEGPGSEGMQGCINCHGETIVCA